MRTNNTIFYGGSIIHFDVGKLLSNEFVVLKQYGDMIYIENPQVFPTDLFYKALSWDWEEPSNPMYNAATPSFYIRERDGVTTGGIIDISTLQIFSEKIVK